MTEKTLYICDFCGETFNNEDSCLIHEEREKHKKFKNRVAFFDGDGNQVGDSDCAFTIWVADKEAFDYVNELLSEDYATIPLDFEGKEFPNTFYYDENGDWRCLSDDVNTLLRLEKNVKEAIDKFPKM